MKHKSPLSVLSAPLLSALLVSLSGCFYGAAPEDEDLERAALGEATQELQPDKTGLDDDIGGGSKQHVDESDDEGAAADPQPEPRKPPSRDVDGKPLAAPDTRAHELPQWNEEVDPEQSDTVLPRETQQGRRTVKSDD